MRQIPLGPKPEPQALNPQVSGCTGCLCIRSLCKAGYRGYRGGSFRVPGFGFALLGLGLGLSNSPWDHVSCLQKLRVVGEGVSQQSRRRAFSHHQMITQIMIA